MGMPARHVLNMVYYDLLRATWKDEDRQDLVNWCTCTVEEALAWVDEQREAEQDDRRRIVASLLK